MESFKLKSFTSTQNLRYSEPLYHLTESFGMVQLIPIPIQQLAQITFG